MLIRFLVLLLCLSLSHACKENPTTPLYRACHWLWTQQEEDGSWKSKTHGLLKGGTVLTPYILFNLLQVPDSIYPKPAPKVQKALDFLRAHVDARGVLTGEEPLVMEYPNYATAYALLALNAAKVPVDSARIRLMQQYLIQEQFDESRGIKPDRWAYGGWGFGEKLQHGTYGHTDLSHTRRILQALRQSGVQDSSMYKKAQVFLALAQKSRQYQDKHPPEKKRPSDGSADGGFFYSPVIFGANKGGMTADGLFASYATATSDGLLALIAAGVPMEDGRIQTALAWIKAHPAWSFAEGIPENHPQEWQKVMKFYHISSKAEALAALGALNAGEKAAAKAVLLPMQEDEGSFFNPLGGPNKEDDPLVATTMAVVALLNLLE